MNDELDFFELQGEPEMPVKAKEATPILPVSQASQNPSESILSLAAKEAGCEITSQEQLNLLNKFIDDTKYGHSSSLPMFCQGGSCPFFSICPLEKAKIRLPVGKACQPAGSLVLTSNRGYVKIEELDQFNDKLVTYETRHASCKITGRAFTLHSRDYNGDLIHIYAGNKTYQCTKDHITIAKWNESAKDLFVVYLMRRGNTWRVGKTNLFWETNKKKTHSGLAQRARSEDADAAWILGLYVTNTEALLAEEYFSITGQVSKSCFMATRDQKDTKYNGLYKWISQSQLDCHHRQLAKETSHYEKFLNSLGLSIDYPHWKYDSANVKRQTSLFNACEVRACNLVSDYMDMLVMPDSVSGKSKAEWKPIQVQRSMYANKVYSLDVDKEHTYITNGIVTHNCPVEKSIMGKWISDNIAALGINPDNPEDAVDMNMIAELAGMELIRYRAAWHLSKDPELVEMRVVGYSPQGEPIYDEKPKMSLLILEKYAKVMGKLRDQLLATRRSQAQVGKISNDLSVRAANMQEKARLLAEKRRNKLQEPESKIETDDSEPG